ncbi:MAG: hypothetical protein JJD97_15010 [Gemmatimonadaceae bacterium]|nr:hypothetical protein [Gemmatimonadaceae bacterium]
MQPESRNETPYDARVAETSIGSTNRRLRAILEKTFHEVQLQSADAPADQQRDMRAALRTVCVEARRSGLRAEQLLVLIKDVWSGLPAGLSRVQSMHGDERLSYVISTCVDEYYGEQAADSPGGREATS